MKLTLLEDIELVMIQFWSSKNYDWIIKSIGFEETQNIKMIMATKQNWFFDDALLRHGRIDRKIEYPNLNEKARYDILKKIVEKWI